MTPEDLRNTAKSRVKIGDIVQIRVKADKGIYIKDAVVCKFFPHYALVKYLTEDGKLWLNTCILYQDLLRRVKN